MTAGKVPSDQEVLFSIELLTIPQVAEWAINENSLETGVFRFRLLDDTMRTEKVPSDEEILFRNELLTIQQVADWARVSTQTIYNWNLITGVLYLLTQNKNVDIFSTL
jgi:P pilus assembly chaperone PapD